jgi:hypothetical protein
MYKKTKELIALNFKNLATKFYERQNQLVNNWN